MGQMQFTPEGRFGFWHQQKFFDHCFPDPRRCLADWLTVPLSAARARAIWHQRKVWSAITNAVDTDAYRRDCASGSTLAGGVHQLMRGCGWKQQQDSLPVPALPLFSGAVEAGDAARLAATVHVFELVLAQVNSERALMPPG